MDSIMLPTPRRAATYRRVSTEEQVSNHSLGNQSDKLAAFAEQQGYAVVRDYVDPGHSGATRKRPGLEQLLQDAKAGLFDTLLIYRLDRLARSTHLAYTLIQELMDAGVGVRSYSEPQIDSSTPMGKVSLGVTAIFAELERDTFMQRSKEGRRKSAASGIHGGGPVPYGYAIQDRRLVVHEQDAAVVRMMFNWSAEHRWSVNRIARELSTLNILAHHRAIGRLTNGRAAGGFWHDSSVRIILKNPVYRGEYQYGRLTSKGKNLWDGVLAVEVPAIVTTEIWEAAQQTFVINARTSRRNAKRIYMLKSLMRCASCGRTYSGNTKFGETRFVYKCGGRSHRHVNPHLPPCSAPHLNGIRLEAQIWERITEILGAPDEALAQQPLTIVPAELPLVEKALGEIKVSQERLTDLYLDAHGSMSKESYLTRLAAFEEQRAGLEARLLVLRDTESHRRQQEKLERHLHDLSTRYRDHLAQADDQLRQTLAHQLIKRISVHLDGSLDIDWVV
jgi:site-specific DNA recombinase